MPAAVLRLVVIMLLALGIAIGGRQSPGVKQATRPSPSAPHQQPLFPVHRRRLNEKQHGSLLRLRGGEGHSLSFQGATPFVLTCAFFAALDALLLGYDIGVVSGILRFVRSEFGLNTVQTEVFASAINGAAIVGALSSGLMADQFGRKPALFISSLMFTSGSFLMALAPTYKKLVFGRIIQGYGVGAGLLISPMFISEIAPPAFRGSLVTLSEVSLSLGVLLAFVVNFLLGGHWRWMLAVGAVPGVLLTLRILFLPESPRFLITNGRTDAARNVLRRTMEPRSERELDAEVQDITRRAAAEGGSWRMLFRKSTMVAVLVGIVLACLQHAVGIESIIYYSPIIFGKAGVESPRLATAGTVCMGIIKLVFETYALLNVDRIGAAPSGRGRGGQVVEDGPRGHLEWDLAQWALWVQEGRRPLLLIGSAGLTLALLSLGTSLHTKLAGGVAGISASSFGIFGSIAAYMALHAISFGPMTWLVLSEIFPSSVRGKAMGIATTVNRATSFVVALTFLSLCERLHWGGSFYLYAGFAAFAFCFYALLVPETTGLKLEQISPQFGEPTKLVQQNVDSLRKMLPARK